MNKQCIQCSKSFRIEESDKAFYKKMEVPTPTLCPDCRAQRRYVFRNERVFYQRKCDLTGKDLVTIYSADGPIKRVYNTRDWFSDKWSALEYGRDFDFSRSFFEQYAELMYEVPHPALWLLESENSDYNHCCYRLKDSYMNSATDKSENAFYCNISIGCRSIADCMAVENSELAIECIDSDKMYSSAYCQQCSNCMNAYLSYDCSGSKYIFGCSGLRNKEYYIYNKSVTKEEWEKRVPEMLSSHNELTEAIKKAYETSLKIPRLYNAVYNSENSTGNYIWNSNNCKLSFDVRESEDLKFITYAPLRAKDGMDAYAVGLGELFYEANFGPVGYNNKFSMWIEDGPNNSEYNTYCVKGCDNIFGSVGLSKQKHVILNKQYTAQEYEQLRGKIIEHMKETGEWGEFFPHEISPFGYNETIAPEYYPLSKDDVKRNGWNWREDTGGSYGKETVIPENVPDDIHAIDNSITKEVFICGTCDKNFRIIPQEVQLYKHVGIALPRKCPDCRHLNRVKLRNPRRLWERQCMCTQPDHKKHDGRCANKFETSYDPERKEIVYCKDCYNKEMY